MAASNTRPAEFAMPHAAMAALRRTLTDAMGADGAARALRSAGYVAGEALADALERTARHPHAGEPPDLASLNEETFWRRFRDLFASRGWGRLDVARPHAGVAALEATDWAEADTAGEAKRPACFFTTGALASLLGRVAGQPVAVLEVECRARGDHACRFLFGAPETMDALHRELGAGATADAAISALA